MENLTEYLDDSLIPLENKVKQYLEVEHTIRQLEAEVLSLRHQQPEKEPARSKLAETEQQIERLLGQYEALRTDVITMLPGENTAVEINLGYGPSLVSYYTIDHETMQPLEEPVLRVVH
ncbi:hypothetical protein [Pontibacter liquoris]|uniref:hypothetical protein n=1 Tax=Pontibacter liquoris TaxID=2905677 RepID=UPI001FA7D256|nr:hypothetical protein [Pontibacter liquoris]